MGEKQHQQKYEKSTSILDQILNNQRPTIDKSGLGYKETIYEKGSSSKTAVNEETNVHPETVRNNERKRDQEYEQPRREAVWNQGFKISAPFRRPPMTRYQGFFYGSCFYCNKFGHKAVDCRTYARCRDTWFNDGYKGHIEENQLSRIRQAVNRNFSDTNQFRRPQEIMNRGYNRFEVLNNESECPK